MEPKKTSKLYTSVTDDLKKELAIAVASIGMTESLFLRSASEALILAVREKAILALPLRLVRLDKKMTND